jgi:hypothetical protein
VTGNCAGFCYCGGSTRPPPPERGESQTRSQGDNHREKVDLAMLLREHRASGSPDGEHAQDGMDEDYAFSPLSSSALTDRDGRCRLNPQCNVRGPTAVGLWRDSACRNKREGDGFAMRAAWVGVRARDPKDGRCPSARIPPATAIARPDKSVVRPCMIRT